MVMACCAYLATVFVATGFFATPSHDANYPILFLLPHACDPAGMFLPACTYRCAGEPAPPRPATDWDRRVIDEQNRAFLLPVWTTWKRQFYEKCILGDPLEYTRWPALCVAARKLCMLIYLYCVLDECIITTQLGLCVKKFMRIFHTCTTRQPRPVGPIVNAIW